MSVSGHEAERYKVVANTAGYINGVFTGWVEPSVNSIMIGQGHKLRDLGENRTRPPYMTFHGTARCS